ncbi:MAG TPA: VCBS repeat-containing protein, partial [Candidatus Poseidoniales archaeon]|nr:VCBS repeat-containing protein [Candidatus Poseidoniales archaeon]
MTRDLMLISKPNDENRTTIARGLVLMLLLSSMMQVFTLIPESNDEINPEISEDEKWLVQAPTLDTGNLEVGGYHLKTGDWWEGKLDAIPDVNDLDGDGVSNNYDNEYWNRNIPAKFVDCAAGCYKTSSANMEDNQTLPSWTDDWAALYTGDLGDMDGDGDVDLVFAASSAIFYSKNVKGDFQTPVNLIQLNSNKGVYLVDTDNDGDLDILAQGNKYVKLLEIENGIVLSTNTLIDITENNFWFRSLVLGDINDDGFVDFVVKGDSHPTTPHDEVIIMLNDASGSPSYTNVKNFSSAESILLIDLNSDGKDDLVLANATTNSEYDILVYQNTGTSPWYSSIPTFTVETDFIIVKNMARGDFNKDGAEDMVIMVNDDSDYQIWVLHNMDGIPATNPEYLDDSFDSVMEFNTKVDLKGQSIGYSYSIRIADMNGDGLLDIITGANAELQKTSIIYNQGFQRPGLPAMFEFGWGTSSGASSTTLVSDIDSNGRKDLVAIARDAPLKIYLNKGVTIDSTVALSVASPVFNVNNYWGNGIVAEANDDGNLDIIRFGHAKIDIFWGDGNLGFNSTPDLQLSEGNANDAVLFDFNRDGFNDLLSVGYGAELRWGTANGFNDSADQLLLSSTSLYGIRTGMVNNDDVSDIIFHQAMTSSQGNKAFAFILNLSSGNFEEYWKSPGTNTTTGIARDLHLADMNGDKMPDLVRCFQNEAHVYNMTRYESAGVWIKNFSNEPMVLTTIKSTNGQCLINDLNDDGKLDFLTKYGSSFKRHFAPNFAGVEIAQINALWGYSIHDIDDDGELEFITASKVSKQSSIYDFTPQGLDSTWSGGNYRQTKKIIIRDMNEDGIQDIIQMNYLQPVDIILGVSDTDYDGIKDSSDIFPNNPTQSSDSDSDGFGDSSTGMLADACSYYWGDSTEDRRGCPDQDGDGWSDLNDDFWRDGNQWNDTDLDGYGDNYPAASSAGRPSHWPGEVCPNSGLPCSYDSYPLDWDDDGYEDSTLSPQGAVTPYDDCPYSAGTSSEGDTYGCLDSDIDGWANVIDTYPTQNSQHDDTDGDGFGDNGSGWLGDHCPDDYGESVIDYYGCLDNDGDGVSYLTDLDDNDSSEQSDTDNDTVGDNGDFCPYQWSNLTSGPDRGCPDSDGDLKADRNDAFPTDATQWADADGDGYGDDPQGNQP